MKTTSLLLCALGFCGLSGALMAQSVPVYPGVSSRVLEPAREQVEREPILTIERPAAPDPQEDSPEEPTPGQEDKGPPRAAGCSPAPARGSELGVWPQVVKTMGVCPARAATESFASQALPALARELWCGDESGIKARQRQAAAARQAAQRAALASYEESLKKNREPASVAEPKKGLMSAFAWSYPQRPSDGRPPALPALSLSPVREKSLEWDEREARVCSSWEAHGAELLPSAAVYALGNARLEGKTCPAALIEVSTHAGRFAGARNYAVIGLESCSGLSSPMSVPFSSAFSSPEGARLWLAELLSVTHWSGNAPRPVYPKAASSR